MWRGIIMALVLGTAACADVPRGWGFEGTGPGYLSASALLVGPGQ